MVETDFTSFEVGTVLNPLEAQFSRVEPVRDEVRVDYPSRLGAMSLDSSKITQNTNSVFPAGQIAFSVGVYKHVRARLDDSGEVTVTDGTPRASMVRHAGLLVKSALGFREGVELDVQAPIDLRHSGLGSSGATLAGAAAAVNELFGNPIDPITLARYCAHNYGEEIDGDDSRLVPVQSIGGSSLCGMIDGGLIVVAGEAVPIYQKRLPEDMKVVIGVPDDFKPADAEELMQAEVNNMSGFQHSGDEHARQVAYRLVHDVLPSLVLGDLRPCKELIFDHRWNMGSIQNCSFVYPRMVDIAESLRDLRDDDRAAIISVSSVGPAFFGLTDDPKYLEERFAAEGMNTMTTEIHNGTYTVA